MINKRKICAVIVTFNRKDFLIECINSLIRQTYPLHAIIIVDNASTDGTPMVLKMLGYVSELPTDTKETTWETSSLISGQSPIKFYYIRLSKNLGSAGGFHEGIKRAYEIQCEWIWTLDDDAEPREDALEKLVHFLDLPYAVALASLKVDENGNVLKHHTGYLEFEKGIKQIIRPIDESKLNNRFVEIDFSSNTGFLISSKVIKEVGFPDARLFIDYDDIEYSIRLRKYGKIYLIPESIVIHKEGTKKGHCTGKKRLFIESCRTHYDKLWRSYFRIRNSIYITKIFTKNKIRFFTYIIKYYFKSIIGILLFDDNKIKRLNLLTFAIIDGLRGVFDNDKPFQLLYHRKAG